MPSANASSGHANSGHASSGQRMAIATVIEERTSESWLLAQSEETNPANETQSEGNKTGEGADKEGTEKKEGSQKDGQKDGQNKGNGKKSGGGQGGGGLRRWLLLGGGGIVAGGILGGGIWLILRQRGDGDYDELDDFDEELDGLPDQYVEELEGDEIVIGEVEDKNRSPVTTMTVDVVESRSDSGNSDNSGNSEKGKGKGKKAVSEEDDATLEQRSSDRRKKKKAKAIAEWVDNSKTEGAITTKRMHPQSGADRLLSELRDPSAVVRRRAIWNLGQQGDSRAIAPLMELLVTADSQQRSIILAVLSEIGTRTLRPMERAMAISLQDSDPEVRLNAIRDLTQVYDRFAQVSRMLAYATEDKDETVQRTAKWALGKLESLRMTSETDGEGVGGPGRGDLVATGEGDGLMLLEQARQAYEDKEYDQAATWVTEALAQEPSHPQVHLLVAEIAIAQEQPVKALLAEQQARDCAWDRGDGATAIVIQDNWLAKEMDPDRAALCHAQAIQALRANQVEDALGLLDEALVCNPHSAEIYMARARVLRQQGKLGEACAHWQKAREIYLELGDIKALKCVQQLLQKFG